MEYKIKCVGDREHPERKVLAIEGIKMAKENGALVIEGYANTKGHPDRYGDVPTVYPAVRNFVYDISEYAENPVLLLNHCNKVSSVMGHLTDIHEDEKGLYFKAVLTKSDYPPVAHARMVYEEGHARGISIAGRFLYENPNDTKQLTYAKIYEISMVAVPADPQALCNPVKPPEEKPEERAPEVVDSKGLAELHDSLMSLVIEADLRAATAALNKRIPQGKEK